MRCVCNSFLHTTNYTKQIYLMFQQVEIQKGKILYRLGILHKWYWFVLWKTMKILTKYSWQTTYPCQIYNIINAQYCNFLIIALKSFVIATFDLDFVRKILQEQTVIDNPNILCYQKFLCFWPFSHSRICYGATTNKERFINSYLNWFWSLTKSLSITRNRDISYFCLDIWNPSITVYKLRW